MENFTNLEKLIIEIELISNVRDANFFLIYETFIQQF